MSEPEKLVTICAKCKHHRPMPLWRAIGREALLEWEIALVLYRSCKKRRQIDIDYVTGDGIWSSDCHKLNTKGDCPCFEEGKQEPRKVLVCDSCWHKPWTWGVSKWIEEEA